MSRKDDYVAYLQTEHWRNLRDQAIAEHGAKCANCQNGPIQVHHLRYGNWYDVTTEDLVPLCISCHEKAHSIKKAHRLIFKKLSSAKKRSLLLEILQEKPNPVPEDCFSRSKLKKWARSRLGIERKHVNNISTKNLQIAFLSNGKELPVQVRRWIGFRKARPMRR